MPPLSCSSAANKVPESSNEEKVPLDHEVADDCDLVVEEDSNPKSADESDKKEAVPMKIVWRNVILFAYLHLASLYGAYLMFTSAMWQTNVFAIILYLTSGVGVTAGAHRLWAHRSYKARLPLRILLAFMYTIAFENDIYEWARDHRVHHKYSETDADPHNATRGFFFAHIGWLLCRKHPQVIAKGRAIDTSDLLADPVVAFHRRYYLRLVVLCCFVLPTVVPMYLWGETFMNALFVATLLRFCFTLNQTWLVNSAAHMWGQKPYDVTINPRQNALVVLGAVGEGFHNYHHTFPYDYATSEYGIKYNLTTAFIDAMALLGLAYDRKTASRNVIRARKARTGEDRPAEKSVAQVGLLHELSQNGANLLQQAQNGLIQQSKAVQNGVNGILQQSALAQSGANLLQQAQNGLIQQAKAVQNGVNGIESVLAQSSCILQDSKTMNKRMAQDDSAPYGTSYGLKEE